MSAEFLVVISALLLIFIIVYTISIGQNVNLFQTQHSLAAMRNAYAVAAALNYVHLAGNGASYNFTLNKDSNENITVYEHSVQAERTHATSYAPLLNGNINTSNISGGAMIIRNNNGAIEIGG